MLRLFSQVVFILSSTFLYAQFPPAADQAGTTAVHKDSSRFINWAKTIEIERGEQNISDDSLNYAEIGEAEFALGIPDNQTVSLGDYGSAILTFDPAISDGEGADFAVFENGFATQGGYFLELAFVEVSSDGQFFVRFPATSLTDTLNQLSTFDLVNPTEIHNLAGKYVGGFGTPFDLAELAGIEGLDITAITHIRLIDVIGSIADSLATFDQFDHKINDPFPTPFPSGGFDLDAVGVFHQRTSTATFSLPLEKFVHVFPNPINRNKHLKIKLDLPERELFKLKMVAINGSLIKHITIQKSEISVPLTAFPSGIYYLSIYNDEQSLVKKLWCLMNLNLMTKFITFSYCFILLSLFSCNDESLVPIMEIEEPGSLPKGVFITNEGAFNNGNASVSFYDPALNNLQENLFETINNKPLGDVLHSMAIDDKKAYLVVNNSSKIEIVRTSDFKSVRTIENLTSPRYIQVINQTTAYVSDLYQNAITIVDLNTDTEKETIPFSSWSEEMVKIREEVFVTQPSFFNRKSSNQLFVINTVTNAITDSIQVGYNPVALALDRRNLLWVLCNGEIDNKGNLGGLYRVNPSSKSVETAIPFTDNSVSFAPRLVMNGAKDRLYFLKLAVFSMSINDIALPTTPLIEANGRDLYGLGVDPETGNIYVGDSGNFVQKGTVTIHDEQGKELQSFKAGVGVNGFYFN